MTRDRRERARIVTDDAAALLYSAPTFDVGQGDPYEHDPARSPRLGPDVLDAPFDADGVPPAPRPRAPDRTIGAALLDQTVAAGIGNYLRAEILLRVPDGPVAARRRPRRGRAGVPRRDGPAPEPRTAYEHGGRTVPEAVQAATAADRDLRYSPHAHAWNTRHWVFRRTNLPCLACDDYVRQEQQLTREWVDEDDGETVEKKRIIYFCPTCQGERRVKLARPHRTAARPTPSGPPADESDRTTDERRVGNPAGARRPLGTAGGLGAYRRRDR